MMVWVCCAQSRGGIENTYHTDPDCYYVDDSYTTHDRDTLGDSFSECALCSGEYQPGRDQSQDWSAQQALRERANALAHEND